MAKIPDFALDIETVTIMNNLAVTEHRPQSPHCYLGVVDHAKIPPTLPAGLGGGVKLCSGA